MEQNENLSGARNGWLSKHVYDYWSGKSIRISEYAVAIEQHVEWISDCMEYLRENDLETLEPTRGGRRLE